MHGGRGPLPDPASLREYESVLPGAAERIFSMTERETGSRHALDSRRESRAGWCVLCAWSLSLACIALSWEALTLHYERAACAIAVTVLATLAGTFVYGARVNADVEKEAMRLRSRHANDD